jgi:FlgD Ig-like domain
MKKLIFIVCLSALVFALSAEIMQPVMKKAALDSHAKTAKVYEKANRDVPDWEFSIDPVGIITNYYDYMPGSYNSIAVREQTGGGIYVVFHARETAASTRRVYYAYIDAGGNVTNVATISTDDLHEGYPGIDLDPVTGDPIVSWHVNIDASTASNECVVSYDLYHLGSPGLWKTPFIVIDDAIPTNNAPSDDFEWPYIFVGASPEADKRRVYLTTTNFDNSPINGDPSENVLIAYADYDENDLNAQSELDWTYRTIPLLDEWHMGNPEWVRPSQAMALEDGTVAYFGYTTTEDATTPMADKLYTLINYNYGEGEFIYTEASSHYAVDNPQNQDGTYRFLDENSQPHEIYFTPYLCNHQNVIFTDNGTKLKFLGNMNMLIYPDSWYPDLPMMYPKLYTYDLLTEEFSFQDMFITGEDPYDDQPMLPWDLDEDGVIDEFDPDGFVNWVDGWPIYHFDNGVAFHENRWQLTQNEENGWIAAVWSEGLKSRLGNVPEPGYEDWAEFPEIAIAVSNDHGETWQETIIMNSKSDDVNYAPELDGMIPCYIYTGDVIEDLGDGYGRLDLMFLDDNSYGSSIQGHGENLGGTMIYTALDIHFGEGPDSNDPTLNAPTAELSQNYPNPFNPSTNIAYNLHQAGAVKLEVYNVKGQKVKTLVSEYQEPGEHLISWNGLDDDKRQVSSGVYFYKLDASDYTIARKMILLK